MPKLGMEETRRKQIVDSTKQCIIKKGISNTSVKDIAFEANISTGVIYHYFKNKEDVLLEALKDSFRKSHEEVLKTVEPMNTPQEKLLRHVENINAVPRENKEFYPIFLNFLGEASHNPEVHKIVVKFLRNLKTYIDDYYLNEGSQQKNLMLKNLSIIVYALGLGLGVMWTLDNEFYNIDEMEISLKEIVTCYIQKTNYK